MSQPKYQSGHYNTNGMNIYTSKATVPLTIFIIISACLISIKYFYPLLFPSINKSEFVRTYLSNTIGLTGNQTSENYPLWDEFIIEKRIAEPKFNFTQFSEAFQTHLADIKCEQIHVKELSFYFGEKLVPFSAFCKDEFDEALLYPNAKISLENKDYLDRDIADILHTKYKDIYPTKFTMDLYIESDIIPNRTSWYGLVLKTPMYYFNSATEKIEQIMLDEIIKDIKVNQTTNFYFKVNLLQS